MVKTATSQNGDKPERRQLNQNGDISFVKQTKQEAQLLLGDRATQKHAKAS